MGDCHYLYGNYMTIKRMTFWQELLSFVGLRDRLHLDWISSAEAQKFARVVTDFTAKIKGMGLSGQGNIRVNQAGCLDRCEEGPACVVYPEGTWYTFIDESDVDEIIESHLVNGKEVTRLKI